MAEEGRLKHRQSGFVTCTISTVRPGSLSRQTDWPINEAEQGRRIERHNKHRDNGWLTEGGTGIILARVLVDEILF